MSRIGNAPIEIPASVTVTLDGTTVTAKGPKGELTHDIHDGTTVTIEESSITVARSSDEKKVKALHGLTRSLIQNIITGVHTGFEKKLEVNGVGFKVNASGPKLTMSLGFSHPVEYTAPEGISLAVDQNVITVTGIDKQKVGQEAAKIREFKKPEPYKGKGIKYTDEYIIRKAGKAAGAKE